MKSSISLPPKPKQRSAPKGFSVPKAAIQQIEGITVEYVLAPKMVVFSHGFGVRRDTSGFFTELAAGLPEGYGYVLFDYYKFEPENTTVITGFSDQVEMLRKVIAWTRQQEVVESISIIAHSMGSIITALLKPQDIEKTIFLAPPTRIGESTRAFFTTRDGAHQREGYWYIPRRDGSTSKIHPSVFDEFEAIDAATVVNVFAEQGRVLVAAAGADEVLKDFDSSLLTSIPDSEIITVEGANHNFEGKSRQPLVQIIREHL